MTREEMKEQAKILMTNLGIPAGVLLAFMKYDQVPVFEDGISGVMAGNERMQRLQVMIEKLEENFGFCVYAVTHETLIFGECYSFLFVSQFREDWSVSYGTDGKVHRVYAYCWNVDFENCSEIGTVYLEKVPGGIVRVG